MLVEMDSEELVAAARAVQKRGFAPYSRYLVGAAVRGRSGAIYTGCNVENASYGATICAERAAICAMVAAGETRFDEVVVYTEAEPPATPCGICRQVLSEFAAPGAKVLVASPQSLRSFAFQQLLPEQFVLERGERR